MERRKTESGKEVEKINNEMNQRINLVMKERKSEEIQEEKEGKKGGK